MIHEYTLSQAILDALHNAGWLERKRPGSKDGSAPYYPSLPGVYCTKRGLEARFFRMVDGKRATIRCGTGQPGLFTRQEEERLHELWKAATAEWKAE